MKRFYLLFILFFTLLVLDQMLKINIYDYRVALGSMSSIYPYGGVGIFENFYGVDFSITYITNKGAAWGLFSQFKWTLFALRCLFITLLAVFACFIKRDRALSIPLVFVIAGAIGNVLDVILHGFVIDMFKFVLWGYSYPVFNLADAYVCIGVVIWIVISIVTRQKETEVFKADEEN